MPQISQIAATYASQIFWLLITFGILYFGIGKMMVPKVMATVDAREGQIAGDLAAAEQARLAADQVEAPRRMPRPPLPRRRRSRRPKARSSRSTSNSPNVSRITTSQSAMPRRRRC